MCLEEKLKSMKVILVADTKADINSMAFPDHILDYSQKSVSGVSVTLTHLIN